MFMATSSEKIGHSIHQQLSRDPLIASVSVDPEIIDFMHMKRNHRKTRLLLSPKTTPTLSHLRSAIESKFSALARQNYKLRYRLARCAEADLKHIRNDVDVEDAIRACEELQSSIQLFVEVNPGVFPSAAESIENENLTATANGTVGTNSKLKANLHPSVLAMRAARLDPAESGGFVMVSFYGFRQIDDPREFSYQLEQLWKPFQALGRVRCLLINLPIIAAFSI